MIVELIYTSAPKTLDGPGYGVVAMSEGTPDRLEKLMRQLSRCDFDLTAPSDPDGFGRAVFSHVTLRDSSGDWHVMSRVGFGGYDFTQRAVFLAHHVAVTADELRKVPPAVLIQAPSLFQTRWEGAPGFIAGRPLPAPPVGRHADAWARIGGNGNWEKAWIDLWARKQGQATFLIAPDGANVLALFADASLDPSINSNDLSFITAMNADRAGIQFDWVGLPAGGDFTRSVLRACPDRTLDLTGPLPTVAEKPIPKPRPAAPKRRQAATAAAPPSIAPADDDQGFHALWKDDPLTTSRRPSGRPQAARPKVPPPPPPPESFVERNAKPVAITAALALAAVICCVLVVKVLKVPSELEKPRDDHGILAANGTPKQTERSPVRKTTTVPAKPAEAGTKKETTTPPPSKKPGPTNEKRPTADPPPPKVYRLKQWLQDIPDGDQTVLDNLTIPEKSTLSLLSPPELGLNFQQLDSGLEIIVTDDPHRQVGVDQKLGPPGAGEPDDSTGSDQSVRIRLDNRTLKFRLPPKRSDELLHRLQLSALEVRRAEGTPLLRIMLTPQLSAVRFFSRTWEPSLLDNAKAFFLATFTLQSQTSLRPHLRIDRVSLSILPDYDSGWLVDKRAECELDAEWKKPLGPVGSDGDTLSASVCVQTYFDRNDPKKLAHTAIEAKLIEPSFKNRSNEPASNQRGPARKAEPHQKEDENATRPQPRGPNSSKPASNNASNGNPAAQTKTQGSNSPRRGTQPHAGDASPKAEITPDQLTTTAADPVFLSELFRRYGRVHGAIVVSVKDRSNKNVDIEVLRFGSVPTKANP